MLSTFVLASLLSVQQPMITPQSIQSAVLREVASQPKLKTEPKDDPDTQRSRLFRWTILLASGLADGYSTDKALASNPGASEGGLIARHFVHGPGVSPYAYALTSKALLALLHDLAAKHGKTQANVSAVIYTAWTVPAVIGNLNNTRVK